MAADSSNEADPLIGRDVAKCRVLELIGQGGMGVVYKVRHRTLRKYLALKVLEIGSGLTQEAIEQFFVEARAQAVLDVPNVIQVYDVDRYQKWFYILMAYVQGPSLQEAVKVTGALPWPTAVRIAAGAARGLHAAHSRRPPFVHRDIKPGNILLGPGWTPKLLDFGLVVEVAEDGSSEYHGAGTANYIAPELLRGEPAAPSNDLYSLGVTLFEAITQQRVWTAKTRNQLLKVRLDSVAPRLTEVGMSGIPPELDDIVAKVLASQPADRHATAAELAEGLEEILRTLTPDDHVDPPLPTPMHMMQAPSASGGHGRIGSQPRLATTTTTRQTASRADGELSEITPGDEDDQPAQAYVFDPLDRLHLPPAFLGRDYLLNRIVDTLTKQPTLVTIEGKPGLGKTRVLDELANRLDDWAILRGAAGAGPAEPFESVMRAALTKLAGGTAGQVDGGGAMSARLKELAARAAPAEDPADGLIDSDGRLTEAAPYKLAALLDSVLASGKALILIDDADRATTLVQPLWDALGEACAQHGISVVAASLKKLPSELEDAFEMPGSQALKLEPLNETVLPPFFTSTFGAMAYPDDLLPQANYLAEGVPGDLVDIISGVVACGQLLETDRGWIWAPRVEDGEPMAIPERMDKAIRARARDEPPLHRQVLSILARVGEPMTPQDLSQASGHNPKKLSMIFGDLLSHQILRRVGEKVTFVSGFLRAELADAVPESDRAALHTKIARILEPDGTPATPARADRLAGHFALAGDLESAAQHRIGAARGFVESGELDRAAEAYESVLEWWKKHPPRKGSGLLRRRRKVEMPDIPELKTEVAELHYRMGNTDRANTLMRAGLTGAQDGGNAALAGRCQRGLALICARRGDHAAALKYFRAVERDPALVDARLLSEIAHLQLIRDQHAKAAGLLKRALTEFKSELPERMCAVLMHSRLQLRRGQWDACVKTAEKAIAELPDGPLGDEFRPRFLAIAARALCSQAKLAEAGERLGRATRHQMTSLETELEVLMASAEVMLATGQEQVAQRTGTAIVEKAGHQNRPYERAWGLVVQGLSDNSDDARDALFRALKLFEKLESPYGRIKTYLALSRLNIRTGKGLDKVRGYLGQVARGLEVCKLGWPRGELEMVAVLLAQAAGDARLMRTHLERAKAQVEHLPLLKVQLQRLETACNRLAAGSA